MPKGDRKKLKADCEDGFTRIANLLIEALCASKLNGTQKGIIDHIIRHSFGWGKKEVAISLEEFAQACDTTKQYISRQLQILVEKNIVIRCEYKPGKTPVYKINTLIAEWDSSIINLEKFVQRINNGLHDITLTKKKKSYLIRQRLCNHIKQGSYKYMIQGLSDKMTVKQYIIKNGQVVNQLINKELNKEKEILVEEPLGSHLSKLLFERIIEHIPNFKKPNFRNWEIEMDQIIQIDKREVQEIEQIIIFAQGDSFWRTNILSPRKLRQQYDMLNAKMRREKELKNSKPTQHYNDYEIYTK